LSGYPTNQELTPLALFDSEFRNELEGEFRSMLSSLFAPTPAGPAGSPKWVPNREFSIAQFQLRDCRPERQTPNQANM